MKSVQTLDYQIEHVNLSYSSPTGLYSPLVCLFLPSTDRGMGNKMNVKEKKDESRKMAFSSFCLSHISEQHS